MRKKGISYFQMEMSAFQYTSEYRALLKQQPQTYFIWEDYALYGYGGEGIYSPIQIHVTPNSVIIFKENRKFQHDFIYNWNEVMREFKGERFCESLQEFSLLQAVGDWFKLQILKIREENREFTYLSEVDFHKRLGVSFNEHLSFQQKLKLFKRDITRYYKYPTELQLTEYFSQEFWYTGTCGKLSVQIGEKTLQLQFQLQQQKVNIYCDSNVVIDEHPLLLQVVKMLMKERAYGQVAQVLLQEEARKLKGGASPC